MFAPYQKVLSRPGALAFSGAGVLARLPMSMVTISIVLLVEAVYHSYTLAGQVAAVYTVAQAIGAPQIAKLVDAHGQARVMRPSLIVAMTGLIGLALAAMLHGPAWALYPAAALAGGTVGSMGAFVRARWNRVVESPRELHTAYSLESALDELVFVVGPVLATTLAAAISPVAGLLIAIGAAAGGGFWFLAQRRTEPTPSGRPQVGDRGSVMRSSGMIIIAVVFVAMGSIFGSVDVATVAFAEQLGTPGLAGVVLGVFACGSLISGLLYGAREFTMLPWKRFVIGILVLAAGICLFVLADSLVVLAGAMFVTGFAIAPTIITGNALVQQLVPSTRLTEGLTWVGTAIGVGFAVGSSVGGRVIDLHGAHAGYVVSMGAAGVAAVIVLSTAALLRGATTARATQPRR
ncbi:MFS transporter [Pseudactinotalea suaedae]|uniref:MFS transporter n=1 Tax=Pseudactinotalea suaedae TaxID=1524924 RepID=UPI001F4FE119|nr:MFS transporter [Pseudactinotalea suaedae]